MRGVHFLILTALSVYFLQISDELATSSWSLQTLCGVNFMVKPNGLLVTVSSTYYYAYTSVLSTW